MRGRPLCLVCLIFIILCGRYTVRVPADSIFSGGKQGMEIRLTGQVYRMARTSEYQILYLKDNSISYQNQSYSESKIFVYDREFHNIQIGNSVHILGEAQAFEGARNTGNFDSRSYYARQGFYGTVYCDSITVISKKCDRIAQSLYQLQLHWSNCLEQVFDEEECGVMKAILLGEKGQIDAEIKALYQTNGISHILAISGLHITFIGMGIYKLVRRTGLGLFLSGVLSLGLLGAYVWMTGMSVSAMRAFLMLSIRVGAGLCGREYDMPTSWLLSGAILIASQPEYLLDAGFLLSFVAVAGVIFVAPVIKKLFPKLSGLVSGLDVGIGVWLALFPLLLYFYFSFPLYGILLNLLVVPFVSVLLCCGIVGSGVCLVSFPVGKMILNVCKWILQYFEWVGRLFQKLPGANIICKRPAMWFIVLYYSCLLLALLIVYLREKERKSLRAYLVFLFIGLVMLGTSQNMQSVEMQVVFLDVGQGDCIFVRGPTGTTYLIDGGSSDVSGVGKYRIIPFLQSQGIGELDYVFVTHGDLDHCSGIEEMLDSNIRIRNLVFSERYLQDEALLELGRTAENCDVPVSYIKQGETIPENGGMEITCLYPDGNAGAENANASSLVLAVSYRNFDILLTGDVEGDGENRLAELLSKRQETYEVLKVAHHGSKNSTTEAFLEELESQIAIISAGENNSYGHPHAETIERLEEKGYEIYNTAECGEIRIVIDEDGANLLTFF